jgi:hypothetical protein
MWQMNSKGIWTTAINCNKELRFYIKECMKLINNRDILQVSGDWTARLITDYHSLRLYFDNNKLYFSVDIQEDF